MTDSTSDMGAGDELDTEDMGGEDKTDPNVI